MTQLELPDTKPSMSPASRSASVSQRVSISDSTSTSDSAHADTSSGATAESAAPSQSLPAAPSTVAERSVTASSAVSASSVVSEVSEGRYSHRDDQRVFGHFLPAHLLHCLSVFSLTLSFAHTFNADIALRKRLYQAGFVMEQAGRLPQLFQLEARVTTFAWTAMFRLWREGGVGEQRSATHSSSSTEPAAHAPGLSAEHAMEELGMEALQDVASGKEADVLTSPLVASIVASGPSLPYSTAYSSSVQLCYHRLSLLTTRLLTDYLTKTQAGQLVALEHIDDVVVVMVDAYAQLRLPLFAQDVDVIVPLFGELAEWGSLNVRGAVRRWIQGKGLRLCHIALHRAQQQQQEADRLMEDDASELEQQPQQPVRQAQTQSPLVAQSQPELVSQSQTPSEQVDAQEPAPAEVEQTRGEPRDAEQSDSGVAQSAQSHSDFNGSADDSSLPRPDAEAAAEAAEDQTAASVEANSVDDADASAPSEA